MKTKILIIAFFITLIIIVGFYYKFFQIPENEKEITYNNFNDNLEVHFINLDNRDAIIIKTYDKVILIDGGTYAESDIIIDYLKKLNITHIDAIISSHIHFNHIQSHAQILTNFIVDDLYFDYPIDKCLENKMCEAKDIKYVYDEILKQQKEFKIIKEEDIIEIGSIKIECLAPITRKTIGEEKYSQNYNSLNFILSFGNHKFFFSGDGIQESNILSKYKGRDLKVDVIKHPHHGKDSLGETFIKKINPKYVVETSRKDYLNEGNKKTGEIYKKYDTSIIYFNDLQHIVFLSDGINLTYEKRN